jgi:hypothetical protein
LSCPDCENRFREYLIFRAAVVRFANYLDDMENERRRILEESRPEGAPPLTNVKVMLRDKQPRIRKRRVGTLTETA